jgi:D-alanine-D-alanine ligase
MKAMSVLLLCGGRSMEHQVSLLSVQSVLQAIDRSKFRVEVIGITPTGEWRYYPQAGKTPFAAESFLSAANDPNTIALLDRGYQSVALLPAEKRGVIALFDAQGTLKDFLQPEVVFPVMHGSFAEDGKMQGLLEMLDVAYVGPDVLSSALAMDKSISKSLFLQAKIPVAPYLELEADQKPPTFLEVKKRLALPLFVKPANAGSSVGVSKVETEAEWKKALNEAFLYDRKILIEQGIKGRELECSVLGNRDTLRAGEVGEVNADPKHGFYSYAAKYLDENGAELSIPANIPNNIRQQVRKLAVKAAKVLQVEGLSRVDFFWREDGEILVNEINTLPGFTKISMYPKLMMETGMSYAEVVETLIEAACARKKRQAALHFSVEK